jgi:hypothetical protein
VRTQAYHALLTGAIGHVFGNGPIWHFNAPTAPFRQPMPWTEALGQPGTVSMMHLWNIFSARKWWTLEPDADNELLIGGIGTGDQRAVAAIGENRLFAIAYVPEPRTVQLDLRRLAGPRVNAVWVNAATGAHSAAAGSPFAGDAAQSLTPPTQGASDADWVLLLDSAAAP